MEYLTVHDLVWINNIVTGEVYPYDYVTLEAAMAAQYQYGESKDVLVQAAGLLDKLLSKKPFASGSRGSALIALLSFLNANGYAAKVGEEHLAHAILDVEAGRRSALEAVRAIAAPAKEDGVSALALRKLITLECNVHADSLQLLAENPA